MTPTIDDILPIYEPEYLRFYDEVPFGECFSLTQSYASGRMSAKKNGTQFNHTWWDRQWRDRGLK